MDDTLAAPAEGVAEALARVHGEPLTRLPDDLYIPPDALEVFLEAFEGPLDLLLYLIKRQNLDVLDIPIAEITAQYMGYIELMRELRLELAAEYLVMAAWLAEIKSRLLLPRPPAVGSEDADHDPRAELIRRLQEYERFKRAAEDLDALPRLDRELFQASAPLLRQERVRTPPAVALDELLTALREVFARAELSAHHQVSREPLSVRERMSRILERVDAVHFTVFTDLFSVDEGRRGVVVTFIAVLELIRESVLELVQSEPFAPIYVRLRTA
ncbi:segregation and condensation protein A [Plasticicumulans acidivorans]|uniref:Segregation and condensation protein A n=1 Tax=Plasticicumulans acidivorans TaxID=886464 RepID=A0A317MRN5_9GAMM|nr:ScpA family protein [Plasticicumulans acidivorans]PWV59472.1 condensin subunit ScpA [Plasticicumulans acidivorans]